MRLIPFFKRRGLRIICMTGELRSPLAEVADHVINTRVKEEACPLGLAPTSSTTLTLALGDAIAVCLLYTRGFSKEDFAITHPLGTLGRKLLITLNDVMSEISQTPFITSDKSIKDAILVISSKGMGFVVIIDFDQKPIGIFTDGDLRRSLEKDINLNNTKISEIMTKKFVVIEEGKLCVEAVNLMEKNKISMLPIVNKEGKLLGAINMRQLLQAGVV
jgi:arabinose-5-phosphate isomerase